MKGMRTKGADLDTNFGPLTASKELRPLARLQRMADKEIPTEPVKIIMDGEPWYLVPMDDSTHLYMSQTPEKKGIPLHVAQLPSKELSDDAYQWLGGNSSALKAEYKRTAAKKNASDGNTPSVLKKDGEVKFTGTHNECLDWLHKNTPSSWDHAFKYEGWTLEPATEVSGKSGATESADDIYAKLMRSQEYVETLLELERLGQLSDNEEEALKKWRSVRSSKSAAIYDGYGVRVTIETKAGDTNESYTMVTSMLQEADIRYREVRRYTVDPDRVLLEVLVRKQDTEIIKELAKAAEAEGVSIYLSDNISEGIKSQTIVTEAEEVEKKIEATKK